MLWRCVGIGPLCHICLCPGPSQHPAVIKSRACCDDIVLFYCSLQTSSSALPSRLVAGWRVLTCAISALTNKLNNKYGKKKRQNHDKDMAEELTTKLNEFTAIRTGFQRILASQSVGIINLNTGCKIFPPLTERNVWGKHCCLNLHCRT